MYKSKDVPWKIKCQRLVDHVYAVFAFGSENWSWNIQTMDKIKGWETKTMIRLFRPFLYEKWLRVVAFPTDENDETRSRKPHKMEDGSIVEYGLAKKIG